ncbi:MAG: PhoH family protein [Bacteroidota bacterium]
MPRSQQSGLMKSVELLRGVEGIAIVELSESDVIRHKLVPKIIEAFDRSDQHSERKPA